MFTAKGKDEHLVKLAIQDLLNYLQSGKVVREESKIMLVRVCNSILNGEDLYSRAEEGRKEEANFQVKKRDYFAVYLLSKAGINQFRITELIPSIGETRNITRVVRRVENRIGNNIPSGGHWYRMGDGYLRYFYLELLKRANLVETECDLVEKFIEENTSYGLIAAGSNGVDKIKRIDLQDINPNEKAEFLAELKEERQEIFKTKRTSKKI